MNSTLRMLAHLSLAFMPIASVAAQSRATEAVAATGSIAGRVTTQGKPLAGLQVALQSERASISMVVDPLGRSETDADGRFQFTGVAAGSYQIHPISALYLLVGDYRSPLPPLTVTIAEGENLTNADLVLIRGSVVTGKITDPEGRPLIEKLVQLDRLESVTIAIIFQTRTSMFQTDDRGIYRVFGIPPGKYRVSSGEGEGSQIRGGPGKSYPRTFHPDVTDRAQATIIDLSEGGEATGVDIRLSPAVKTYAIAGRAIDAESKQPVANVTMFLSTVRPDGRFSEMRTGGPSGPNGEFRIEGVRPGQYAVYAEGSNPRQTASVPGYSDPVNVEIAEGDASGVEVRIVRGGSISGVAVVEGVTDPAILSRLTQQMVSAFVRPEGIGVITTMMYRPLQIAGDGRFRVEGLRPGKASINHTREAGVAGGLVLTRIERDGQPMQEVEVGVGEHVTGVRLIFVYGNAIIRGQVVVTGGNVPPGGFLIVSFRRVDGGRAAPSVRADARGNFVAEGLAPGQYELMTQLVFPGQPPPEFRRRISSVSPPVSLANGQSVQVNVTIDLGQQ